SFIILTKDATENARQIERLKNTISDGEKSQRIADRALRRLQLLRAVQSQGAAQANAPTGDYLKELTDGWRQRAQEADDLVETARQQLQLRQDAQANASSGFGTFFSNFFKERGFNLLLALTAFASVFIVMGTVGKLAGTIQRRNAIPRSFSTRLIALFYKVLTVLTAFFALLAVFNAMNDWLLLGIASIFAVAAAWIGLKMLPTISEQITLLLNLGAVQEGERVLFAGVPWNVERLDMYTDLVNPELDGGTFTLPVRELIGLHSRPAADAEPWFPTRKGDWVQLNDERIARVVSQTPELVQLVELGGSRVTMQTEAFVAEGVRNLSTGYRIKTEFGLDYSHQAIATREIPDRLKSHVHAGLVSLLGDDGLVSLEVDLAKAGDSALIYEVEADIAGEMAPRYEDVEREIITLLVEACNAHNWQIPFPQLVVHRP
ncbi:MAG: hypothetical protein AAFO79_07655, partial [Pseudomonadota bacterium]